VVNDLLRLTEAENANFNAHEDNLDLRNMCDEIITTFKEVAARRKVEIRFEDDEEVPQVVRCDPSGLRQVLSNLMANAIEHSGPKGGLVQVHVKLLSTTDTSSLIEISFQDQGLGLSEQDLDTIFQDFEQVLDEDDSQIPEIPTIIPKPQNHISIGLGLATTARFVRLNHGQISIASEKGHGTRVSINVPFRKALRFHRDKRPATEISLPTPPDISSTDPDNPPGPSTIIVPSEPSSSRTLRDGQYPNAPKRRKESPLGPPIVTTAEESTSPPVDVSALSPVSPIITTTDHYPFPRTGTQQAKHKFRVLVAEDNPLNSRLIEARLVKSGHEVTVTMDGQACADAFRSKPGGFDVILMDIQVCRDQVSLILFYPIKLIWH